MRSALLVILVAICSILHAQKELGSFNVAFNEGKPKNTSLYTFSNGNKDSVCTIAFLKGKGKGFVFGPNGKLINNFSFDCPFNKAQVLAGFIADGSIQFLIAKNSLQDSVIWYAAKLGTDSLVSTTIASPVPENKQLIGICNLGNKLSYLAINKKEPVIRIHQLLSNGSFATKTYDFSNLLGKEYEGDKLYDKLNELSSMLQIKMAIIDDPNTVPVQILTCHKKLYLQKNHIDLAIETRDKTDIFSIDLETDKHNYKKVTYKSEECADKNPNFVSYNTYFYNQKLFSVIACSAGLQIQIIDSEQNKLLKSVTIHPKDELVFKNTPVLEETERRTFASTARSEKEIEKTQKVIKKMADGWSLIIVRPDSLHRTELTIGGYLPSTNANSAYPIYGGLIGGAIGGLIGALVMPVAMSGNDWVNTIHFKSLLNENTLEHVEGSVDVSVEDYKSDYKIANKLTDVPEIMYRIANKYYYAYIDKVTGAMKIVDVNN